MSNKAPGKYYRKGLSLMELYKMFPDDTQAEQWFAGRMGFAARTAGQTRCKPVPATHLSPIVVKTEPAASGSASRLGP